MRRCTMIFYSKEIGSKIYSTLPGNQSIPLQFTPQAAPLSFSQLQGYPENYQRRAKKPDALAGRTLKSADSLRPTVQIMIG